MAAGAPCIIGRGITIRGNLTGQEPLTVEGRIEGTIAVKDHVTGEQSGVLVADVDSQNMTVHGEVNGNIKADDMVAINATAKVLGNVRAPRVVIEEGARFKGGIEMDVRLPEGIKL